MTITLRNLPPQVERAIRDKAKKEGLSLNRTVAKLLAEATGKGPSKPGKRVLHHDLDHLAGKWTKEEADEFDAFLRQHRSLIDSKDWQ